MKQGYFIEWNGEHWQTVFPSRWAHLSQNHETLADATQYMLECRDGMVIKRFEVHWEDDPS